MKRYLLAYLVFIVFTVLFLPIAVTIWNGSDSTPLKTPIKDVYKTGTDEDVVEMDKLQYLISITGSQIDKSYPDEAIKAQAVACYTLFLYNEQKTDSALSTPQYVEIEDIKEDWGDDYSRLENCVKSVHGQYLVYDDQPIMAVYHSVSPGKTENAEDILGENYPYLKSVDCSGDILSPDYLTVKEFTQKEIKNFFKGKTDLQDEPKKWFSEYVTTSAGGVISVMIGDTEFSGEEVAEILSLPSRAFDAVVSDDLIKIRVKGKGLSIGMSQYGAYNLATLGEDYQSILGYFYNDCSLRSEN